MPKLDSPMHIRMLQTACESWFWNDGTELDSRRPSSGRTVSAMPPTVPRPVTKRKSVQTSVRPASPSSTRSGDRS
jgi:hypothetical protein